MKLNIFVFLIFMFMTMTKVFASTFMTTSFTPAIAKPGDTVIYEWSFFDDTGTCDLSGLPGGDTRGYNVRGGSSIGSYTFIADSTVTASLSCHVYDVIDDRQHIYADRSTLTVEDTSVSFNYFTTPTFFYRNETGDPNYNTETYAQTISWSSNNADECRFQLRENAAWAYIETTGRFENFVITDGSGVEYETMSIKCWNADSEAITSNEYTIYPDPFTGSGGDNPPLAPFVELTYSICNSTECGPNTVYVNVLAQNADSCVFNTIGLHDLAIGTNASVLVTIVSNDQVASATCTGPGGTSTGTLDLPPPTSSFIDPGDGFDLR